MLRSSIARATAVQQVLLSRFSRETSSGRFIPEMDGLRFAAITMVVLFHLNGYLVARWPLHHSGLLPQSSWLAETALVGFRGVELFFVISGFILALPFASQHLAGGSTNKPAEVLPSTTYSLGTAVFRNRFCAVRSRSQGARKSSCKSFASPWS